MTTSGLPFSTVSPTLTLTPMMLPGIGAPTLPRLVLSAFSRTCISNQAQM